MSNQILSKEFFDFYRFQLQYYEDELKGNASGSNEPKYMSKFRKIISKKHYTKENIEWMAKKGKILPKPNS